jgi:hypothetical protein
MTFYTGSVGDVVDVLCGNVLDLVMTNVKKSFCIGFILSLMLNVLKDTVLLTFLNLQICVTDVKCVLLATESV